ncbi:MAG: hypothetical protein RLZZ393_1725 [Pseudomonadota bacterium]
MPRSPLCRVLLLACLAAHPAMAPAAVDPLLVKIEPGQRKTVGIKVEPVRVAEAGDAGSGAAGLRLPGRVVLPNARQDVLIANVAGRVEAVLVNAGDSVRAGQPLLRVHSGELLALQRAYLAAQAQAGVVALRVARDEALFKDGVIGASRVETTRADGMQAQASLREQRQLLRIGGMTDAAIDDLKSAEAMTPLLPLAARHAGRVLSLDVRAGDRIEVGAPLATVAPLDELWVDLQATRDQAAQLAVGDQARLPGCAVTGRLIAAGIQLDATSQTTSARARFEGAGRCVSPNQYVQVTVSAATPPQGVLSVPASALFHHGGRDAVFIEQGDAFRVVDVKIERHQGDRAWLRADALRDAKVVTAGVAALKGRWQGLGSGAGVKGTD